MNLLEQAINDAKPSDSEPPRVSVIPLAAEEHGPAQKANAPQEKNQPKQHSLNNLHNLIDDNLDDLKDALKDRFRDYVATKGWTDNNYLTLSLNNIYAEYDQAAKDTCRKQTLESIALISGGMLFLGGGSKLVDWLSMSGVSGSVCSPLALASAITTFAFFSLGFISFAARPSRKSTTNLIKKEIAARESPPTEDTSKLYGDERVFTQAEKNIQKLIAGKKEPRLTL
jgi:hypothetical protein